MSGARGTVSVIVPLYNGEAYLAACVDRLLSQTEPPAEILLVDDGSADGSAALGEALARTDGRIRLIRHERNRGAGAARNTGMDAARGEYLLFLDVDDLYEETLIRRAVSAAEADGADVVLFGADHYLTAEDRFEPAPEMLALDRMPARRPFTAEDAPDRLFQLCTPEVWNKLFRRRFVEEQGLRFQELPNANDLCFALSALALGRITVAEDILVHYRVDSGGIQAGKSRAPLAFRAALEALRDLLQARGRWELLEGSFAALALFHINYNYRGMRTSLEGDLRALYREFGVSEAAPDALPEGEFGQYAENLLTLPDYDPARETVHPDFYRAAARWAVQELRRVRERETQAWERADRAEAAERERSRQLEDAWQEAERIKASATYRAGRLLTAVPRALRSIAHKEKP